MLKRNAFIQIFRATVLVFMYCAPAYSVDITIKGTPTIVIEKPIELESDTAPTTWEYRFYPSQTGPEVAVQCESEAYRFLDAVRNAGQDRWELVNFIDVGPDEYNDPCLIGVFKRPESQSE